MLINTTKNLNNSLLSLLSSFLLVVGLSNSLFANSLSELDELNELSDSQEEILIRTYIKAKNYNLELTMTAICWQESQFGKYMVNLSDPSFGPFHNLITSVQKRHRANEWNTDRLVERLMYDYNFAFGEALSEIKFWQRVHRNKPGSWSKMISSYNAGYNTSAGQGYLFLIKQKVRALKEYIKDKPWR